jgi:hypothetical protein
MIQFPPRCFDDSTDDIWCILAQSLYGMTATRIRPKQGKSDLFCGPSLDQNGIQIWGKDENRKCTMKRRNSGFFLDAMRSEFTHGPEDIIIFVNPKA